jgi:hypothetical protein
MALSSHHMHITTSGKADRLMIVATAATIYDLLVTGERAIQLL